MANSKWQQAFLYVKRDANGVIVQVSETVPEDYQEEDQEDDVQALE